MSNLISQFARRIEKYFSQLLTRPKAGPAGTNHIDDPASWAGNEIYKGELILNTEDGAIYTSDGTEIIQLNTEDKIIAKGNFSLPLNVSKYVFNYSINNSLTFSMSKRYVSGSISEKTTSPPQ